MSYQLSDPTELLGEAPPTISFPKKGDKVRGTIMGMVTSQQRAYDPNGIGDPLFYSDGRPRQQVVITLQTGSGGTNDPHDGMRRLFVKGQMQQAIKLAIKDAARSAPAIGAFLEVEYIDDEPSKGGGNDKKIYRATYIPQDNGARRSDGAAQTAHQEALSGQGF
jgi:hypothetical protein